MDETTSSHATTDRVSQFHEQQADQKHEVQKKLDLPPEYDENNSSWTLKHPTPAEGLVDLMDSGVYVNAEKLVECQFLSSNSYKLAQLLLTEIFTINALSTCSWPGANANATDIDDGYVKPELDEHATNILLKFVKEYAQLHEWELEECHCIVKHLRRIMLEMRHKKERDAEILPPVNSQSNSRWTLKYPEPVEGVVELVEHSGVYVNIEKLAVCVPLSNDCVTLARMLFREIFTAHALSTCSLPDASVLSIEMTEQSETDDRSVLDDHALSILLLFVFEHARDKNWILKGDEQIRIQESIHQKMELLRRVEREKDKETHRDIKFLQGITLKYLTPAEGLVELVEHSGLYVDAAKLANCKKVAKSSVTLAQMLLTEVFNEDALRICSLSENNNICYGLKTPCIKNQQSYRHTSTLDEYAEIIFLNFVDEYGLDQGFTVSDFRYIRCGMVQRMREIREEYELKQTLKHISSSEKLAPVMLTTTEETSNHNVSES